MFHGGWKDGCGKREVYNASNSRGKNVKRVL